MCQSHLEGSLGQREWGNSKGMGSSQKWQAAVGWGGVRSELDTNGDEGINRYCEFAAAGGKGEKVWGQTHDGLVATAGGSG